MDTEAWYKEKLASVKDDFDFRFESVILDITETIREKLKEKKLTKTKLAERLGVTPAAVSKLLRGEFNFTIKKLMEIADAIELSLEVDLAPKKIEIKKSFQLVLAYSTLDSVFEDYGFEEDVSKSRTDHVLMREFKKPMQITAGSSFAKEEPETAVA